MLRICAMMDRTITQGFTNMQNNVRVLSAENRCQQIVSGGTERATSVISLSLSIYIYIYI